MHHFKYLLFLFFFLFSSLHAISTVDVTSLQKAQPLKGPWAFAPSVVTQFNDVRLEHSSILLPQFIEKHLEHPRDIVTLALALKTIPNVPLSLNMKQPYSVWKLYADGKLIGSSGKFHLKDGQHKADAHYPIIHFTPTRHQTQLILYLANSQHRHIGFYGAPLIAPQGVLEHNHIQIGIVEKIVASILFLFGIYHIGLFAVWKKDRAPFWFGMVCISFAIRMSTTGEKIILELMPNLSWEMLTRIEYASGYLALPFFVLYFGSLYPKQTSRFSEYFYLFIGLLFTLFAFAFSTIFLTASLSYYNIVALTFIFYIVWVLYKSLRDKERGSILAFSAFILFSATILHDLLLFENIILFLPIDLMPYGFITYLFAQATILLLRYANAFHLIEKHTNNLEEIVAERTQELTSLVSQRELLLRELTHRVKNNLQFIVGLLWIQRKESDEKTQFTLKTLESQIQSIATVHEALSSQNIITAIEITDYIRKLILSLQQLHPQIEITLSAPVPVYIKTDHTVSLGLIINELITNHIKYSDPSNIPSVHIFIEHSIDQRVVLHYNDTIDHRETFANAKVSSFGLPKLGWPMIKEFIKQMDGKIIPYHDHIDIHFSSYEYL